MRASILTPLLDHGPGEQDVKVQLDRDRCQGHGRCYTLATNVFDADDGVNHEWTAVLDDEGQPRSAELWTTCYTPRELRLLARIVGLFPLDVYGVTPGGYGPFPPSTDCPEFLLVAGRRS